ncbi:hypothetical protein REPUB_Repub06bG0070500 [Reevesia pubescens]
MEATKFSKDVISTKQEEKLWEDDEEFEELVQTLPKAKSWFGNSLSFYQGFWCPSQAIKGIISFQKHFQALDNDIVLASLPKSGTTWLKALTFSIVNRNRFALKENPLLSLAPHQVVPFLELDLYLKDPSPDLENIPQPRIFSTHIPFASLPPSIKEHSNSKIVYICRNPLDMFVSHWHFSSNFRPDQNAPQSVSIDEAFEMFCQGIHGFGPFCDNVSGYWKASQENPNKILFLKYEELKEDIVCQLKKLAKFLGFPFTEEEEKQGVAEEITKLCSFDNLKELKVNKNGKQPFGTPNHAFFRKGEVGDWSHYLTPSITDRFEKLIQDKLDISSAGLKFKLSSKTNTT